MILRMSINKKFLLACFMILSFSSIGWSQTNPFGGNTVGNLEESDVAPSREFAIKGTWVNVRTGPGTDNSILDTLQNGSKGKLVETKKNWTKIDFGNGKIGWVYNKLLKEVPRTALDDNINSDSNSTLAQKNQEQFQRWEKYFGDNFLNYKKFPFWYFLSWANYQFNKGNYEKALEYARKSSGNPIESLYMQAKALDKLGNHEEAASILEKLKKGFEDKVMVQKLEKIAKPYIDEKVVFKFGGFDDIKTYREKKKNGARIGLESSEYYKKYVNLKTWKWRSKEARNDFKKIAGIDCSGLVQLIQKEAFAKANVKYPIKGRTSTRGLWSGKYTDEIDPGYRPPPPPDIRPGDMILLDYGINRYGHSMIFKNVDSNGNIHVIQMGHTAQEAILSPSKFKYYKGAFRMKGMDKVRKALIA